jgi:hypothetical protein
MWGAFSDERMSLSFTIATGPHQSSLFRVRVPWNLRPYFPVPDSRLPFASSPTTRRATVEVFDPTSHGKINWIREWTLFYYLGWIYERALPSTVCVLHCDIRCKGNVLTEPLLNNELFQLVPETCASGPLASNGLFLLPGVISQYRPTKRALFLISLTHPLMYFTYL